MILGAVVAILIVTAALLPRIPQDPAYHNFADTRSWFGIPNFLNVVSNLPFLLVGFLGFRARPKELWEYRVCFAGVFLTGFGSAWYHANPNNATLVWDRLPMAIGFMGLLAALIVERTGRRLLIPLAALGAASVIVWQATDDLRLYALVQFGPALVIPALIFLYPARYTNTMHWFRIVDKQVFTAGGVVSGHTLKHLAAAMACYEIWRMVTVRRELPCSTVTR